MSTNQTDRDTWRKFLGIKNPSTGLESGRVGGSIGRTAGRSGGAGGGGSLDTDSVPEGEKDDEAEKGDGAVDAGKKLNVGDEADRLEDLYDCETSEKVTIDGLGEKGSEGYPTGFQDCNKTPCDPADISKYYEWMGSDTICGTYRGIGTTAQNACGAAGHIWSPNKNPFDGSPSSASCWCGTAESNNGGNPALINSKPSQADGDLICEQESGKWPAVDRNHLTWNKEKGCFEPLCPELNNQVLGKYRDCEPERILCDKDGNKVKVTVDGDTVKVTQAKYNQTAEIKDGKVQTVKKHTESQTEAEFK